MIKTKTARKSKKEQKEEDVPVEIRPEIPNYNTQLTLGKVLLWFHANNIKPGQEYRCRFRMVFANPLLTYDKDVEEQNRKDAYVPSIKTKWSEWSEPVSVKREVDFFLTGAFPRGQSVTVTVFTRWMDQRLKYPISKVMAGQRIRGSRKVKVLNPLTGEAMKDENGADPVIQFDTGAVAIQLDFNRRIQTSAGVRDDVEMIYLDPQGHLQSRSLYIDRNSPKYKELENEAKEAAAAFEPEPPRKSSRRSKKDRAKKRKLKPMDFGDPAMPPPDMDFPRADDPFKAPSRGRRSPSKK